MTTEAPSITNYRLQGRWLLLARAVWVLLTLITVAVLVLALSELYIGWKQPCNTVPQPDQASCYESEQAMQHFGLTGDFFAVYYPIGVMVEILPWILAGALIFWKKSPEPFGFFFSLMLVLASTFNLDIGVVENALLIYPIPLQLINGMTFIGGALLILWYRFPDGHFVPRWLRWAAVLWVALHGGANFFAGTPLDYNSWPGPASAAVPILFAASIIYSLVYRFRQPTDLVQRQQIKWVVLSASIFAMIYIIGNLMGLLGTWGVINWDANFDVLYHLIYSPLSYLSLMFVGVSLGFSILRYRLWDIDFIINRSLVYGALTGLLLVFFGLNLLLVSQFLQNMAGGPLAAAAVSAVLFGVVFQPARRNLQRFVDRRFYNIQIDYQNQPTVMPPTDTQATFGSYRNLELLGRGGMGEVYKARNVVTDQVVALKLLPAQLATDVEFRRRFEREAKIAAALSHPNIVRVFETGEINGAAYIVMEYIQGQDLSAFLRQAGPLSLEQALPILRDVASALDYAHAQGLVHRDIKPSNVMLAGSRAILMDFGIAKMVGGATALTQTGGMLGTMDYIAPEQIQAAPNIDQRADIYALGVMVFQLLTGELPFKHNNPGALLIAHLTQPPPDPCGVRPNLPVGAAYAVQRAMAKHPAERFATVSEFVAALG